MKMSDHFYFACTYFTLLDIGILYGINSQNVRPSLISYNMLCSALWGQYWHLIQARVTTCDPYSIANCSCSLVSVSNWNWSFRVWEEAVAKSTRGAVIGLSTEKVNGSTGKPQIVAPPKNTLHVRSTVNWWLAFSIYSLLWTMNPDCALKLLLSINLSLRSNMAMPRFCFNEWQKCNIISRTCSQSYNTKPAT